MRDAPQQGPVDAVRFDPMSAGRDVVVWAVVLFAITGLGVLSVVAAGIDPAEDVSLGIVVIGFAPTLAALAVAGLLPRAGGVRALLRQLAAWRVGVHWYLLALAGPIVLVLVAYAIHMILGGDAPARWFAAPDIAVLIGPLIAGSLGEEIGWRGFAQPRLQQRASALTASVIIGVLWATWHLWPVFAPGSSEPITGLVVLQTYVRLIATAIVYAWMYNSTRGSLPLVMVAHAGHNIAVDIVPAPADDPAAASLVIALLYAVAAVVVVWATGARTLSHWTADGPRTGSAPAG